jgi:hypothetical protein
MTAINDLEKAIRIEVAKAMRRSVASYPAVIPHLSRQARIAFSIKADISDVNATYHDEITQALVDFFEGASITTSRNAMKRAMIQAFGDAFDAGWIEGGGTLPIDEDAMSWLEDRLNQEAMNIDGLFLQAKELRKLGEEFDYFTWLTARADMYTQSAASVHNAARLLANNRQMYTWHYGDTDHCNTCQKLNGQRHRASWYIERNYIPGKPGASMDCGGFRCRCFLTDKDGNRVTI